MQRSKRGIFRIERIHASSSKGGFIARIEALDIKCGTCDAASTVSRDVGLTVLPSTTSVTCQLCGAEHAVTRAGIDSLWLEQQLSDGVHFELFSKS